MKPWDAISAEVWNSLSVNERKSLVSYLRFIGCRVKDYCINYNENINTELEMLMSSTDNLLPVPVGHELSDYVLSEDEVRKMISLGMVE